MNRPKNKRLECLKKNAAACSLGKMQVIRHHEE